MPKQEYVLAVNLSMTQQEDGRFHGQGLEVREHIVLPAMSFLELAAILGQFHNLAERIKAERAVNG